MLSTTVIMALIVKYSTHYQVDPTIALAVAERESNFQHHRIGSLGEVGVFQLRPEFFPKDAAMLERNVKYGVKFLAFVKANCVHQIENTWIVCYNVGITGAKKIRYPLLFPYYKEVMYYVRERNTLGNLPRIK